MTNFSDESPRRETDSEAYASYAPPGRHTPRARTVRWSRPLAISAGVVAVAVAAGAVAWTGRDAADSTPTPAAASEPAETAEPLETETPLPVSNPALEAALALRVVEHTSLDTYDRDVFAWRAVDLDRNGCDTRNDVLRRDLSEYVLRDGTNGCLVETGVLHDPYTGAVLNFVRGSDTSAQVQIDHVVALANAWVTGAQSWDTATLERFGNDPLNLLAVDGATNQSKGAGNASQWLPPNADFRCAYVARQVAVKTAYDLGVSAEELSAFDAVLAGCPDQGLLTESEAATP